MLSYLGSVKQLPNAKYMLSVGKRIVPRKGDVDQTTHVVRIEDVGCEGDNGDNRDNGYLVAHVFYNN